jgi:cytochrome c peroxidase
MNQDLDKLERELSAIPGYVKEFKAVFETKPDREGIAKALAAFQRTLVTEPSPFDKYLRGDKEALSDDAKEGLELFRGDAGCIECHHGPLLSDGKFYRIGVSSKDLGRAKVTGMKEDRYRFRTPSLRNIAETGPYMHDGSMKTLDEVVTFYYRGIPDAGRLPPDTSALVGQSFSEIGPLVEFLKSLSGKAPKISPPLLP